MEGEYRDRLRAAEAAYANSLARDIESGALEGADWCGRSTSAASTRCPRPLTRSPFPAATSK